MHVKELSYFPLKVFLRVLTLNKLVTSISLFNTDIKIPDGYHKPANCSYKNYSFLNILRRQNKQNIYIYVLIHDKLKSQQWQFGVHQF